MDRRLSIWDKVKVAKSPEDWDCYHDIRGTLLHHEAQSVHLIDALVAVEGLAGAGQKEEESELEHDGILD